MFSQVDEITPFRLLLACAKSIPVGQGIEGPGLVVDRGALESGPGGKNQRAALMGQLAEGTLYQKILEDAVAFGENGILMN